MKFPRPENRTLQIFLLGCTLFLVDFLTKLFVHHNIPMMNTSFPFYPYGGYGVFYDFHGVDLSIVHVTNKGAAWGLFSLFQKKLMAVRFVTVVALFFYTFFWNEEKRRMLPLMLIISGAFSNVIDFFLYGHVVDMIHFKFWGYSYPVFNIADSLIFLGVFTLLWQSFFSRKSTSIA